MPRLWLVTRGAQAVGAEAAAVEVSQAPVWGLGGTLSLEHPELGCTRVDLSSTRGAEEASSLLRELGANDGEDQIALREQGRYVARLARGSFKDNPAGAPDLQADGSYLITGGLGGLGLSVAQWMVACGARHLALLGRSGASEAARSAILAMEEAGAEVLLLQADVPSEPMSKGRSRRSSSAYPRFGGLYTPRQCSTTTPRWSSHESILTR